MLSFGDRGRVLEMSRGQSVTRFYKLGRIASLSEARNENIRALTASGCLLRRPVLKIPSLLLYPGGYVLNLTISPQLSVHCLCISPTVRHQAAEMRRRTRINQR